MRVVRAIEAKKTAERIKAKEITTRYENFLDCTLSDIFDQIQESAKNGDFKAKFNIEEFAYDRCYHPQDMEDPFVAIAKRLEELGYGVAYHRNSFWNLHTYEINWD